MKYLNTAFGQLAFAWKLYHYGLEGKIKPGELDADVTFHESDMFFVVPKALGSDSDLIIALQNNLTIAFGAAAITLNRVREEQGIVLPNPISSDEDQCVALIYQVRNAFAHDIAEPRWQVFERYRRVYEFAGRSFDLRQLNNEAFEYRHLGGPDGFYLIKDFFAEKFGIF
ncbi:MAG: hypothetical protein WAT93_11685 [Pontixanthobacter sp.]